MTHRSSPRWLVCSVLVALLRCLPVVAIALPLAAGVAEAQGAGSTEYLIRLLRESEAFRVRVRAADALGSRGTEAGVQAALVTALGDENAAVRAAAAASLGRVGDASAVAALRRLSSDAESAVRTAARDAITAIEGRSSGGGGSGGSGGSGGGSGSSGTARFYVGVGVPATITGMSDAARRTATERIRTMVGGLSGVIIAPEGERPPETNRVLRDRGLTGFFLDFGINIEDTPAGVRVTVNVNIQDYPGRNLRAMATGRATLTEMHDTSSPAVADALSAALTSALRSVPATLASTRGGSGR